MIFTVGRVLEHSIAAHVDSRMRAERAANVAALPPMHRRMAELMMRFNQTHPHAAAQTLDGIARMRHLRYLGTGIEYTVYHDQRGQEVVKVHRDSAAVSEVQRRNLQCEKAADRALLANYLGSNVVSQSVEIGRHVFGGYRVLLVRQPFVNFKPEEAIFTVNEPNVDRYRLEKIVRRYPSAASGLAEFAQQSRKMFEETNLLPDTNGRHNVVAAPDGMPTLIDTTPIPSRIEFTARLIMSQLASLETGLREVV